MTRGASLTPPLLTFAHVRCSFCTDQMAKWLEGTPDGAALKVDFSQDDLGESIDKLRASTEGYAGVAAPCGRFIPPHATVS